MAKPCRCKKPGECEECPEWIFTFADLVMLMMGFFVILWVLKPNPGKDAKKDSDADQAWIATVAGIRGAFGYIPDAGSSDPVDKYMLGKGVPRVGRHEGDEQDSQRQGAKGTNASVTTIRPGKQTSAGGALMFDASSVELSPPTRKSIDEIAEKIRGHYNIVLVTGHASLDDLPDESSAEQRMELSLKRAQAVRAQLISKGVNEETIRIEGASTYEPVRQRQYGTDVQMQNRRVEIEVSASVLEERQGRGKTVDDSHARPSAKPEPTPIAQ